MTRQRIPARPTLYKGVLMRSRMEAQFARSLDADGVHWEYEPVCFADDSGQYLPDFRVTWYSEKKRAVCTGYIEVNPYIDGPEEVREYQRRMEIIWSSEPDTRLLLINMSGDPAYAARPSSGWQELWAGHPDDVPDIFGSTS